MGESIIGREIRRCNRNLLLVNLGLIVLLLLWLVLARKYLYNCVAGPFPIAASDLPGMFLADAKQEYFTITEDLHPIDTGVYISHKSNGIEASKERFLAARLGNRFLLIKVDGSTPSAPYEAALAAIPSDIQELLETGLRRENLTFETAFYPFMLDGTSYRSTGYIAVSIGLAVFAVCSWNLKKTFIRMGDWTRSPIYFAARRYGADTEQISRLIDGEVAGRDVKKFGAFLLTPSWLIHKTFFSFTPFHLSDIMWVYAKRTQHFYSFIPTGKSHAIVIADACGRVIESDLGRGDSNEMHVQKFVEIISSRIPWIISGYNDGLKNLYERSRQEFVSAVEERRRQYKQ